MLQYAITVAKNGFYFIIVQGSEAGGHRFVFNNNENNQHIPLIGTILFVPQIVNSLKKEDYTIPLYSELIAKLQKL